MSIHLQLILQIKENENLLKLEKYEENTHTTKMPVMPASSVWEIFDECTTNHSLKITNKFKSVFYTMIQNKWYQAVMPSCVKLEHLHKSVHEYEHTTKLSVKLVIQSKSWLKSQVKMKQKATPDLTEVNIKFITCGLKPISKCVINCNVCCPVINKMAAALICPVYLVNWTGRVLWIVVDGRSW